MCGGIKRAAEHASKQFRKLAQYFTHYEIVWLNLLCTSRQNYERRMAKYLIYNFLAKRHNYKVLQNANQIQY